MTSRPRWFNLYLAVLIGWAAGGCAHTKDPGDDLSTLLRVHLEATSHTAITKQKIYVYRAAPVEVEIEALHLLTEAHVVSARVVEELGTYAIEIRFNQWAIPLLTHNSSSYQGRRIAIQTQFGPKQETVRWIAAPRLREVIDDGVVRFTPDATREEAYQIAAGLNNNARKVRKPLEW